MPEMSLDAGGRGASWLYQRRKAFAVKNKSTNIVCCDHQIQRFCHIPLWLCCVSRIPTRRWAQSIVCSVLFADLSTTGKKRSMPPFSPVKTRRGRMFIVDQVQAWMKAPLLAHFWAGSAFTLHFRRWARGLRLLGDGWLSLWWCDSPSGLVLTHHLRAHVHTHTRTHTHVSLLCVGSLTRCSALRGSSDLTWLSSQNTSEPKGDDGYLPMWENSTRSVWVQCCSR